MIRVASAKPEEDGRVDQRMPQEVEVAAVGETDAASAGGVRDALEAVGIGVAATFTKSVIEVARPADRHVSRYGVAKLILKALGDEAFSDQYEFVLDGESLSSELIDAVCASVMDHAV